MILLKKSDVPMSCSHEKPSLLRSQSHNQLDLTKFQRPDFHKSSSMSKLNLSTYNCIVGNGIFVGEASKVCQQKKVEKVQFIRAQSLSIIPSTITSPTKKSIPQEEHFSSQDHAIY
jgi:hypothetical protein